MPEHIRRLLRHQQRLAKEEHTGQHDNSCAECFPILDKSNDGLGTSHSPKNQNIEIERADDPETEKRRGRSKNRDRGNASSGSDEPPRECDRADKSSPRKRDARGDDADKNGAYEGESSSSGPRRNPHDRDGGSTAHDMNGVNGTGMAAGMGLPTPAGHQMELNYIYGMVEELSRQLAENRKVTDEIVSGLGRVRQRARDQDLSNEEIIKASAGEINSQEENLEVIVSVLSEALDKAKYSRDANASLLNDYGAAMSGMLKQFHEYKARHLADVSAWHRSYRVQLSEERAENCLLREQIWDMQERAARLNRMFNEFRAHLDADEAAHKRRVTITALRQEVRFWKRMAMPEIPDDDSVWSADSDLVDPAEKERLRDLENKAVMETIEELHFEEGEGVAAEGIVLGLGTHVARSPRQGIGSNGGPMMGGALMQRADPAGGLMCIQPPSRPGSAASSTGSSGQN